MVVSGVLIMEWIKIEAGEYRSKDDRFHIFKSWDRIHGNSWQLTDLKTKQTLNYDTLKQCKSMAEDLMAID